jgi:hypothetical protein
MVTTLVTMPGHSPVTSRTRGSPSIEIRFADS